MLFMGEEWAADQPFPFFCDFGPDLAAAVRNGRREEFSRFPEFQDPAQRERIPDPIAEATFQSAKLDWGALDRDGRVAGSGVSLPASAGRSNFGESAWSKSAFTPLMSNLLRPSSSRSSRSPSRRAGAPRYRSCDAWAIEPRARLSTSGLRSRTLRGDFGPIDPGPGDRDSRASHALQAARL